MQANKNYNLTQKDGVRCECGGEIGVVTDVKFMPLHCLCLNFYCHHIWLPNEMADLLGVPEEYITDQCRNEEYKARKYSQSIS